ncbi:bifunctional demethylmenaquinone methyltransferase/2-methoxy-6-polyprenyl-1,4-benzoquinol methylase UbiE [bacterium]|nr:bifunctional demethylmenaquinone methyltransferase/2-methoxy-6-polyprenyl-1,4-benzoquinol methylase UbiE [bacterium]
MSFVIPEGKEKSTYVRKKFSKIADKYDLFNDLITQGMHRYWKRFLVKKAELNEGSGVLDICCGTGDITQLLKNKVGERGQVIGLDFSSGMLKVAGARNINSGANLLRGDASVLPLKSCSLDAVTVGYGLRNLIDIEICLKEVLRVLKPGGRFLSLDMGKVKIPVIKQFFDFYFFSIVPRIGKMIYPGEDMFDYFPQSSVNFPSQEKLSEMLENVGFTNVRFYSFYFGGNVIHYAQKPDQKD